ncbi:hypothetical protein O181_055773, partial [Austropuccinia psidii MF-1]|nr:hypothetical protein [Austropuccinia psidii MF-1]
LVSENVVTQEKIETASTVTSIIPSSTANSDYNSTAIITQKNQPEPIPYELISLDIINTPQKAKNLAKSRSQLQSLKQLPKVNRHNYDRSQSATEGQGSVDDSQIDKLCHSEADNTVLPLNKAYNTTRSLSGDLKRQPEGIQQCIAAQRVPDPFRFVEKLHQFLPDCEKFSGPSQHLQVAQWMEFIYRKEIHDAFNIRMEEKQPSNHQKQLQHEKVATSS